MPHLDRPGMIGLLERLGAESDATALEAARALHRQVGESGFGWDAVLRTGAAPAFGGAAGNAPLAETSLSEESSDQSSDDDLPAAAPEAPAPDQGEALRLIDRLLASQTLSGTLREDLIEMKRGMAEGSFDAMDARYVRALAKRLGA
jgi:hypothetical protein